MLQQGSKLGRRHRQAGVSLVEIMVVITIMALVMGAVGVAVYPRFKKASCTEAWKAAQTLQGAITQYRTDNNGDCPKSLGDLKTEKIINKDPVDPWGQAFNFKCPGEHDEVADIWSNGPDKQGGTADDVRGWMRVQEQCK